MFHRVGGGRCTWGFNLVQKARCIWDVSPHADGGKCIWGVSPHADGGTCPRGASPCADVGRFTLESFTTYR